MRINLYGMNIYGCFLALWLCVCSGCFVQPVQAQRYKDPSRSAEERAADLLRRMTLEEKIAQIRHIHSWISADRRKLPQQHEPYTEVYG